MDPYSISITIIIGAPAEGPGEEIDWGRDTPKRLDKAPTDYTKPQQTMQRPKTLYKTFSILDKTTNVRQEPNIFNKRSNKYQFNMKQKYQNLKTPDINQKMIMLIKGY